MRLAHSEALKKYQYIKKCHRIWKMIKNQWNSTKKIFSHRNFEVTHSAQSGPLAQNSLWLFIYSWASTNSTILDRNPHVALEKVPLLVEKMTKKWQNFTFFWMSRQNFLSSRLNISTNETVLQSLLNFWNSETYFTKTPHPAQAREPLKVKKSKLGWPENLTWKPKTEYTVFHLSSDPIKPA